MKINWRLLKIIAGVLTFFLVLATLGLAWIYYQTEKWFDSMAALGPCVYSCGPFTTQSINVSLDTLTFDYSILYPRGIFVFSNTQDTLPIKILRLDKTGELIWAREIVREQSGCGIKMRKMKNPHFSETDESIYFEYDNSWETAWIVLHADTIQIICSSPL